MQIMRCLTMKSAFLTKSALAGAANVAGEVIARRTQTFGLPTDIAGDLRNKVGA